MRGYAPTATPARSLVLGAAALALASCHAPITQVVVVVESDLEPADVVRVAIAIGPAEAATHERTVEIAGAGGSSLPFSFGVRARAGRETERVRIHIAAQDGAGAITARTSALVPFVRGETRRLVLRLERACREFPCEEIATTCRAGVCVDAAIPESALEPIAPGDELDRLPPFPDASVDAGPVCTPTCNADETCTAEGCRCGARASCGEGALCESGACVAWPRSCDASGRGRGCDVVAIEGGTFEMGDEVADASGQTGAFPVQPAIAVGAFTIDAYEVTVARFRAFWAAGHPAPDGPVPYPGERSVSIVEVAPPRLGTEFAECNWSLEPGEREAHPINCLTWSTALAFCAWDGGRLPTEAEWEWAARGRAASGLAPGRDHPWGDERPTGTVGGGCDRAHAFECAGRDGALTREVGAFAPAAGVYDQIGNVSELTADHYDRYGATLGTCWTEVPQTDPLCRRSGVGLEHAVRGGSYSTDFQTSLMSATRRSLPEATYAHVGMRCVR